MAGRLFERLDHVADDRFDFRMLPCAVQNFPPLCPAQARGFGTSERGVITLAHPSRRTVDRLSAITAVQAGIGIAVPDRFDDGIGPEAGAKQLQRLAGHS